MSGFCRNVRRGGSFPGSVILLAATNRPEVLDRALLRPGRFDRLVVVDAPDIDGREAILRVRAQGKPLAPEVDLPTFAGATAKAFAPASCSSSLPRVTFSQILRKL